MNGSKSRSELDFHTRYHPTTSLTTSSDFYCPLMLTVIDCTRQIGWTDVDPVTRELKNAFRGGRVSTSAMKAFPHLGLEFEQLELGRWCK